MTFSDMLNDNVTLMKKNGDRVEAIKAIVQSKKTFINRSDILIETGDLIQRKMSDGGEGISMNIKGTQFLRTSTGSGPW